MRAAPLSRWAARLLVPGEDRPHAPLALALAAIAVGTALQLSNGHRSGGALAWLTAALVLSWAALALPSPARAAPWLSRLLPLALGAGLAWQLAQLMTQSPGIYLRLGGAVTLKHFYYGLAAAAVLVGAALQSPPWLRRWHVPLIIATHFLLGHWLIRASPDPFIDVVTQHRDSLAALLRGENPYALTFPNIYGHSDFAGPGVIQNGRFMFGFGYPPVSLLLALPGHVLAGDYRYSLLAAMGGAAALIAYSRPGTVATLAAALYLFTPRTFFVLEQGWTEPFLVLLLAAIVFTACRAPRLLPYAVGLCLASKQYAVLLAPAAVLLFPGRGSWRQVGRDAVKALLTAAAVTLPFLVVDPEAFFGALVEIHLRAPFRPDSLGYPSEWLARHGEPFPPALRLLGLLVPLTALLRAPRTPASFAAAGTLLCFTFFLFRQGFGNYYFLVVGGLCAALAAAAPASPVRALARDPSETSSAELEVYR